MCGPNLRTKPKFIRLCTLLNLAPPTARGLLEFLWDSVYDTGNAVIGDAAAIEAAAGWSGEPGKFCQALLTCGGKGKFGFIEEVPDQPDTYQLHDLLQHTPADRQREWIRLQERMERGTTISDIRRAAANARWAKKHAADANSDANSDAKSCKPMQMDAVCMQPQTCINANDTCKPIPQVEPVTLKSTIDANNEAQVDATVASTAPPSPTVPSYQAVYEHFKLMAFYGDVHDFLARFRAAIADPKSRAARKGWQNEAYLYVCETQAKQARGFPVA